jgi:hypothetical protein
MLFSMHRAFPQRALEFSRCCWGPRGDHWFTFESNEFSRCLTAAYVLYRHIVFSRLFCCRWAEETLPIFSLFEHKARESNRETWNEVSASLAQFRVTCRLILSIYISDKYAHACYVQESWPQSCLVAGVTKRHCPFPLSEHKARKRSKVTQN